ncbi:MAG: hypothetical protein HPY44_17680 [Armatimonadetes bacterium]|nr:hypothetical protein [Armatimonadota bacterium]
MELTLSDQERDAVRHALEVYLGELREEIVKTEKREWKTKLHEEEDLLKQVLARL